MKSETSGSTRSNIYDDILRIPLFPRSRNFFIDETKFRDNKARRSLSTHHWLNAQICSSAPGISEDQQMPNKAWRQGRKANRSSVEGSQGCKGSENATASEVALVREPEPMSGVTGGEEEWRELGGTRVPKKEWVKRFKDQMERDLKGVRDTLSWLEVSQVTMGEFAQVKLGCTLAFGEIERLNAKREESEKEVEDLNRTVKEWGEWKTIADRRVQKWRGSQRTDTRAGYLC